MQLRVAAHQSRDLAEVVAVNGLLELPDFLERIDVSLELWPAGESIQTGNLKLRVGDRPGGAGFQQILGLVLEMAEIGTFGKGARRALGIGRHCSLLSSSRP